MVTDPGGTAMRRILGGLVAAMVLTVGLLVLPSAWRTADATPVANEALFVARLNELRAAKRLAPLSVDPRLTTSAREWAQKMARRGDIFHNMNLPNEAPDDWLRVGENVGVARLKGDDVGAVDAIHDAFVASPTHYKNLVGRYDKVGVGVVFAHGQVFVAEHFMQSQPMAKAAGATVNATQKATKLHWLHVGHAWSGRAA